MTVPIFHCCIGMNDFLQSGGTSLEYNPKFREYGMRVMDGGSSILLISFCPWCGQRLPSSLRETWFARVDALGLEPDDPQLPDEMQSDIWWMREGIE